tara:strand:+ start:1538 stop:2305 length:768 start_codon:yes stop_codon:yes gene_type:complete
LLLHYKQYGQGKYPVFILHGLFGMLDNWHLIANKLQEDFTIYTVDQRNHGLSFHSPEMDYTIMAKDLENLATHLNIDSYSIIGHSMGGKTAMQATNISPAKIDKLVVVDIAPKKYWGGHEKYFEALKSITFENLSSRKEANLNLLKYEKDEAVRMFLLKNLKRREEGGYKLKMNLPAIENNYKHIMSSPVLINKFSKPTLFVKGAKSNYIQSEDFNEMRKRFPNYHLEELQNAGHWVHAENSDSFLHAVGSFLLS